MRIAYSNRIISIQINGDISEGFVKTYAQNRHFSKNKLHV